MQSQKSNQIQSCYAAAVRVQDLGIVRLLPLFPTLLIIRLISGLK